MTAWTTDPPSADGWYAFRWDHDGPPTLVKVYAGDIYLVGTEGPYRHVAQIRGHWRGPLDVEALCAEQDAVAAERERCLYLVHTQPYYPDTQTGLRQRWVLDQLARKIEEGEQP